MPGRRRHPYSDRAGPSDVLARLRTAALQAQALLLDLDPILGEPTTQRAVDDFVEYAADALRALAEAADPAGRRTDDASAADLSLRLPDRSVRPSAVPDPTRRPSW